MEEEYSVDPAHLLEAAANFAYNPVSDASAQEFLHRFPLPAVINALQTKAEYPGLENALIDTLERIFKTKYGASLIPHFMSFVVVGLGANSQKVRCLSCKVVSSLLEHTDEDTAANLVLNNDVYQLLLNCLIDGDEQVATASMDAIKNLAGSQKGLGIVFSSNNTQETHLGNLAGKCSSLGRVRILALIVKLFSISSSVASIIYSSKLLSLLVEEVRNNADDTLVTLSVLELLYELAEVPHSTEFLSKTTLLQLLSSMISNASADSIIRSRAMMIGGRLLLKEDAFKFVDESSLRSIVSAIDRRFESFDSRGSDECEYALEALGQIGTSNKGAALLLSISPPAARHVVDAAFDRQQHNKQLAALHALANIIGVSRPEVILNSDAEESLRRLIYEKASRTSRLTPSGIILSVLQQDSELRLAGYRLITGLVARPWCLMEILSKQEIIDTITDTVIEDKKIGMEARHACCEAIQRAITSSSKLINDPSLAQRAAKVEEAIKRGPYGGRKRPEAQPLVMTAERF